MYAQVVIKTADVVISPCFAGDSTELFPSQLRAARAARLLEISRPIKFLNLRTSSENVTSCFHNHFSIIQSYDACKMRSTYPGWTLQSALQTSEYKIEHEACKTTVFHCKICKFVTFLLPLPLSRLHCTRSFWLSKFLLRPLSARWKIYAVSGIHKNIGVKLLNSPAENLSTKAIMQSMAHD